MSTAISPPPRLASASSGSVHAVRCERALGDRRRPCARRPSASRPVPGPATSAGSLPVSQHASAVAGVVLPIPISPPTSSVIPSVFARRRELAADLDRVADVVAWRARARRRGSRSASGRCGRRRGASSRRSRPRRRRSGRRRPRCASTDTAPPPDRKVASICAVTSGGKALTPSAATPWSAAATTTRALTCGRWLAGHAREPDRELLEPPEAPGRLDELRLARARGLHRGLVERLDLDVHGRAP